MDAMTSLDADRLAARYEAVRAESLRRCAPFTAEDQQVQSMPEASPLKWHLAHTSWFFAVFVLAPRGRGDGGDRRWHDLFNSYYESLGRPPQRGERGTWSRPSLTEVRSWRARVDAAMESLLRDEGDDPALRALVELGLAHEQQHQELMLTDIQHALWRNPLRPAAPAAEPRDPPPPGRGGWWRSPGGIGEIGADDDGFAFDNERPRHRALVEPYALATALVGCGEYRAFIADGGYARPELWLAEGWAAVRRDGWRAPLYWRERDGAWWRWSLGGERPLRDDEPVAHVSYLEADAFARWAGARLPTEIEWELAIARERAAFAQIDDARWQWTASAYAPYRGYRPAAGALGEYNGKFMCGQLVLRGGSCATPRGHARASYRNFFPPAARWQFTGIRLARDA